jgi:hypothetical protein
VLLLALACDDNFGFVELFWKILPAGKRWR